MRNLEKEEQQTFSQVWTMKQLRSILLVDEPQLLLHLSGVCGEWGGGGS